MRFAFAVVVAGHAHADVLAGEVGCDMTGYWQPTAASEFGRVSKERIVQAVRGRVREHEEASDGRGRRWL